VAASLALLNAAPILHMDGAHAVGFIAEIVNGIAEDVDDDDDDDDGDVWMTTKAARRRETKRMLYGGAGSSDDDDDDVGRYSDSTGGAHRRAVIATRAVTPPPPGTARARRAAAAAAAAVPSGGVQRCLTRRLRSLRATFGLRIRVRPAHVRGLLIAGTALLATNVVVSLLWTAFF
jgi:hypothetical protein